MSGTFDRIRRQLRESGQRIEDAADALEGRIQASVQTLPPGRERRRGPRDVFYDSLGTASRLGDKVTLWTRIALLTGVAASLLARLGSRRGEQRRAQRRAAERDADILRAQEPPAP